MRDLESYPESKRNRNEKRRPKTGKYWCPVCDMVLVGDGQKCPVCKKVSNCKRDKKSGR